MAVRLPDATALGRRPVPQGNRGFAQQDTDAVGVAVAQLGVGLGKVAEEFQQRDDEQKVLEFRRKLIEWDKANVHDPENGAVSKRGKDAFDLPKTLPESFDKFAEEASKGLSSNRQRMLAREMAMSRRAQVEQWASGHALREREQFEAGEYEANIAAFKDQATLYPALAAAELGNMEAATRSHLGRKAGPEAVAAKIKADASEVHSRIVSSLVKGGDVAGAEAYLKANGSAMNAQARDVAHGLLREVGTRRKVQAFEDEIRAADVPLNKALDQARDRFRDDPASRDAAVSQIKTLYAEREAIQAKAVKDVSNEAWSVLMAKGSMSAIPAATMKVLRDKAPEEERQMRDWLEAKWHRAKADAEGKGNDPSPEKTAAFIGLLGMATDKPYDFASLDLARYEPLLTKQQFDKLVTLRVGINRGEAKTSSVLSASKRAEQLVLADMKSAGLDTSPKEGSKQAKDLMAFRERLHSEISVRADGASGPLDEKVLREVGRSLLREGIEQGSGFLGFGQTTKRGFQMEPGKTYVVKRYGDIPQDVRTDLVEAFAARRAGMGKPVPKSIRGGREYILTADDEAEIERAYTRGVEAGRFK